MRHATAGELSAYVLGTLDARRAGAFEAHCASCDACAVALAGEARLELALERAARQPARLSLPAARPLRAAAYGGAGLLAMAAAVALWFAHATATPATGGEGTAAAAAPHAMGDGAILDAYNDALDGG